MGQKLPDWLGKRRIINKNFEDRNEEIIRWEVLEIPCNQRIKVRFISTASSNRQGIRIAIDAGDGELTVNGVSSKAFDLWEDNSPREFEIDCHSEEGYLSVYNIFERLSWTGKCERCSQMDYSGMILEQNNNIYRYRCNDTGKDTDFEKLVFEIELL